MARERNESISARVNICLQCPHLVSLEVTDDTGWSILGKTYYCKDYRTYLGHIETDKEIPIEFNNSKLPLDCSYELEQLLDRQGFDGSKQATSTAS